MFLIQSRFLNAQLNGCNCATCGVQLCMLHDDIPFIWTIGSFSEGLVTAILGIQISVINDVDCDVITLLIGEKGCSSESGEISLGRICITSVNVFTLEH